MAGAKPTIHVESLFKRLEILPLTCEHTFINKHHCI